MLHVGIGSAAALDREVADVDRLASIHTGLTQRPNVPQPGGTSRATTPEVGRVCHETHNHTHVLDVTSIKVMDFDAEDLENWFAQLELQFAVRRVTSDSTKFFTAASKVPPEIFRGITQRALLYEQGRRYESLKNDLRARCQTDRLGRARAYINHRELGDSDPWALFDEMETLAQGNYRDIAWTLWIQRLPQWIQERVHPDWLTDKDVLLPGVQQLWNRYKEIQSRAFSKQAVHEVESLPDEPQGSERRPVTEEDVERLCEAFFKRKSQGSKATGTRPKQKAKPSTSQRLYQDPKGETCQYHFTFGAAANKCTKAPNGSACRFPSGNGQPGR